MISGPKWKKFKLNKAFKALPVDGGDEMYPNGLFEFNVTKLLISIQSNPNKFKPEQIDVKTFNL